MVIEKILKVYTRTEYTYDVRSTRIQALDQCGHINIDANQCDA